MTNVAISHLKKDIEIGVKMVFKSLATIKLPDHTMVANKANRYPEYDFRSLIMNKRQRWSISELSGIVTF